MTENMKKYFSELLRKGKNTIPFENRAERSQFISKIYKHYLKFSVLDVGCSENTLKSYLPENIKYVGIDISGKPDFIVNLEEDKLKMFEDQSFYIVVCTDVLEHLDNIHEIFDDLCRVSKKYIIVSLPNNWIQFKFSLMSGMAEHKFYGLPVDSPEDRHKWVFNHDQALNFLKLRGRKNNFKIINRFSLPIISKSFKIHIFDMFFKLYYGNRFRFNNLHYSSIWVLLKRSNE